MTPNNTNKQDFKSSSVPDTTPSSQQLPATVSKNKGVQKKESADEKKKHWLQLCEHSEQAALVQAAFGVRLSSAIGDTELRQKVIAKVTKWRAYVGASRVDDKGIQISFEADFIINHYGTLTLEELDLCIEMFVMGELYMKERDFIIFSPMFIGQVIGRFIQHKKEETIALKQKLDALPPPATAQPTPKQIADDMRYMIKEVLEQIDNGNVYVFMCDDVFRYFRKMGMELTPELVERSREYGHAKMDAVARNAGATVNSDSSLNRLFQGRRKSWFQDFCKEYCVIEYVKRYGLQNVLNAVKEQHFIKTPKK